MNTNENPGQEQQSIEPTYYEGKNGNLIVDDEGSGYILHKNPLLDDSEGVAYEEGLGEAPEDAQAEAQLPDAEGAEELDLSLFDGLESSNEEKLEESEEQKQEAPEFTKFKEDFKKHLGVELDEALGAVKELQSLRAELYIKEQERSIQNSWGVDDSTFQSRMQEVRAYAANVAKTKPELFQKLDNPEGVKLIWAKLEQDKQRSKPQAKQVPGLQRNSQRVPEGAAPKYEFTYSAIQKMSREDYEKNAGRIANAFATGRVDMKR